MTAPALHPDATRCPQCSAPLAGSGSCQTCGLRLTGPDAARLWEVDSELLRLDAARLPLLAERSRLLAALRGHGTAPAPAPVYEPVTVPAQAAAAAPPPAEWTPKRVQNTLLGLGGLLLAVAALVFAAVTYDRLGAGGRALVLLTLTLAAALAVPRARLRGLASTAETLTAVALALAALDAYGLRTLGLADDAPPLVYAAGSAAALAALSAGYAALVPVRLAAVAAAILAQLPVVLLLAHLQPPAATAGLVLAGLALADLALVVAAQRRLRDVAAVGGASAAVATAVALLAAASAALGTSPGPGAVALLVCALVLVAGAAVVRDPGARVGLLALPVGVVALAAHALARPELSELSSPLVPAAVALVALQAAAVLPRALRTGPVLGALAVVAAAVAAVGEQVLVGALAPVGWLLEPWSLVPGLGAREALSPGAPWGGTLVAPVVLAAAATVVVGAGLALHRVRTALVPAAVLVGTTAVLLPVGLDLPYTAGLAVLVALGTAAVLVPVRAPLDVPVACGGVVVLLLAGAWSSASQTATLAVLALVALALAGLALRGARPALAGAAALLAGLVSAAELGAVGAAAGLAIDQTGALLVLAAAALAAAAAPALGAARRAGVEAAAVAAAAVAVVLAARDTGWLSWTLAGLALVALAAALRGDRRPVALAGGLLLSASSWVRLAAAGVTDPEPYVLPLAIAALVLGHLRRRAVPATTSFAAYGPGLSALLVPTLVAAWLGGPLLRPLLLAGAALAVVLLGARGRLRAPLVVGGAVLAADAALLAAPYAAALPRWLVLGVAGMLLLAVGATYEQRLRDLVRLRDRYDALA